MSAAKKWIELEDTYLSDGPPKAREWSAWLFVNRCELRPTKTPYVRRLHSLEVLRGKSKRDLDRQVAAFANRPSVRLLAPGVHSNDFTRLPRRAHASNDLLDGTAAIYAGSD